MDNTPATTGSEMKITDVQLSDARVKNPASVVRDVAEIAVRAWTALPLLEKTLLKVTMRVSIVLALARFLAVQSHNSLVTLSQDVLRDGGVQSALGAALSGLVGN